MPKGQFWYLLGEYSPMDINLSVILLDWNYAACYAIKNTLRY